MGSSPLKRRAYAPEDWAERRKSITSGSLAGGGIAAPATLEEALEGERSRGQFPRIIEAKPEEIPVPSTRQKVLGTIVELEDGSVVLETDDEGVFKTFAMESDLQKLQEVSVLKPFAGYVNWDACVKDQVSKGKSKSEAEKICGALQRDLEKEKVDKSNEDDEFDANLYCPIVKTEEIEVTDSKTKAKVEKRLVTGIVLQPETVDAQGDVYDEEVIQAAAHDFLREYNSGNVIGFMHKDMNRSLDLVESYIAPTGFKMGDRDIKKGTWLMTVHVVDKEAWEQVKKGKIRGFSIGGVAKVKPLEPEDLI